MAGEKKAAEAVEKKEKYPLKVVEVAATAVARQSGSAYEVRYENGNTTVMPVKDFEEKFKVIK